MAARYQYNKEGNEISNEMPSYSEAEMILNRHGYPVQPLRYQDVNGALFPFKIKTHENRLHLAKCFFNIKALNKKYRLSYPMVGSYSDILIVSKKAIRKFCHYCGVFAANELTSDVPVYFDNRPPVLLGKGIISPFNTQNTIIRKELFALMYLPTYVTFRFTDILRGFIAQPIMWLNDYHLGFVDATVVQKRNPHDYVKDFISEIPMYKHCEEVMEIASASISAGVAINDNLYNTYEALLKKGIVEDRELNVLSAWLKDIS